METLRIGIIGAGNPGVGSSRGNSYAHLCRAAEGAMVVAVFDVVREHAERACAEIGRAEGAPPVRPFDRLEPFLEAGLDAVVVASPLMFHAEQSIAALERGIHVLSEVTAAHSLEAARALAEAARRSTAHYMLAENYRYLDEVEHVKRMVADGRFGRVYFGEGEYVHDCKGLWRNADGSLTWRAAFRESMGIYCTHSLGPLLYVFDDRPVRVTCMTPGDQGFDPGVKAAAGHVMLVQTARGHLLKVRVDHVSPRPHTAAYYAVQGTAGCYEGARGLGDAAKIWLEDEHGPSFQPGHAGPSAPWHPLAAYREQYLPDRLHPPEGAARGGHGTSEYWMLRDFLAAIREDRPPPIDVYTALDYTVPGILGAESARRGGEPMVVPDFRALE
jgi:predicted dehydrogenase